MRMVTHEVWTDSDDKWWYIQNTTGLVMERIAGAKTNTISWEERSEAYVSWTIEAGLLWVHGLAVRMLGELEWEEREKRKSELLTEGTDKMKDKKCKQRGTNQIILETCYAWEYIYKWSIWETTRENMTAGINRCGERTTRHWRNIKRALTL